MSKKIIKARTNCPVVVESWEFQKSKPTSKEFHCITCGGSGLLMKFRKKSEKLGPPKKKTSFFCWKKPLIFKKKLAKTPARPRAKTPTWCLKGFFLRPSWSYFYFTSVYEIKKIPNGYWKKLASVECPKNWLRKIFAQKTPSKPRFSGKFKSSWSQNWNIWT